MANKRGKGGELIKSEDECDEVYLQIVRSFHSGRFNCIINDMLTRRRSFEARLEKVKMNVHRRKEASVALAISESSHILCIVELSRW